MPRELHRSSGRHWLGFSLALTTVALWGVLPLALKALQRSIDSGTIVWFRFLVSALVVGAILAARGKLPRVGRLAGSGWALLACAAGGLGLNYIFYMYGLARTTPATSQVVIQLAPPLLALGGLFVFRERFSAVQWTGFAAVIAGLVLFSADRLRANAGDLGGQWLGIAWIVFAAIGWASYGLAQKQLLLRLPSQGIMLLVYIACAFAFLPLAQPTSLRLLTRSELGVLLFTALNTAVAYGAFSEALEHWEASRVSAVLTLTPLATIGFSALCARLFPGWVGPDPLPPLALVGAGLVVCGSMASALGRRARPHADARPSPPTSGPPQPPPGQSDPRASAGKPIPLTLEGAASRNPDPPSI